MSQTLADDRQFKRRLDEDDIEELMIHAARCPEILEGVTDLDPCRVDDWFAAVWKAAVQLVETEGTCHRREDWREQIEAATEAVLHREPGNCPDVWNLLFGRAAMDEDDSHVDLDDDDFEDDDRDDESGEYEDDVPDGVESDDDEDADEDCFFEKAFAEPIEELDPALGRELLQHFLYERLVEWELGQVFPEVEEDYSLRHDCAEALDSVSELARRIDGITATPIQTLDDDWDAHEEQLDLYRGRELIGLKTGIAELDKRTLGLRGLGTLGSPPNLGKTALTLQIALGVCQHHKCNDAVAVYVSLDMPKKDLYSRIKCNLADMEAAVLFRGSAPQDQSKCHFNKQDQKRLRKARQLMASSQIGQRLLILDRQDLGDNFTTGRLLGIIDRLKSRVKASRALVIVDYLQILPVPSEMADWNENEQDRQRIRIMQDLVALTKSDDNPVGDAVLFISEARKPSSSKEQWGTALSEFMGTARLTYAVDYALIYRRMGKGQEVFDYYGVSEVQGDAHLDSLDRKGVSPIMLCLEKARDGMVKGQWGMEFHFKKSIFKELQKRRPSDDMHIDDDEEEPIDSATAERRRHIHDIGV